MWGTSFGISSKLPGNASLLYKQEMASNQLNRKFCEFLLVITTTAPIAGVRAGWGRTTSVNGATEEVSQESTLGPSCSSDPKRKTPPAEGGIMHS